jgi:hypothetical protein
MRDWGFAQTNPSQELALLHQFSVKKPYPGGEVEFRITVKEFVTPKEPTMLFFAQADKQTNQNTAPYTPCGWGKTLLEALSECIRALNKFLYEG